MADLSMLQFRRRLSSRVYVYRLKLNNFSPVRRPEFELVVASRTAVAAQQHTAAALLFELSESATRNGSLAAS